MANQFDTSFIPQQPLLRVEGVKGRHEPINFALVLALILFFVTLIIAGGIYFYADSIDQRILDRSAELEQMEKGLDRSKIAEYKGIESRIANAKAVLRDHSVFSVILPLLEEGAAENVGLTKLDFEKRDGKLIAAVEGVGPSYDSVYFQMETWRKVSPIVLRVDLDKITLDDMTGVVSFSVNIILKPDQLRYMNLYKEIGRDRKTDTSVLINSDTKPVSL